jgi:AraC-like DNA-binding protein
MDVLSDLMRVLRFTSGVFLDVTLRAPWCMRAQVTRNDCGPGVDASGGLVAFHFLLDGELKLRLDKVAQRACGPGDLILLSRNDPHWLGTDLTLPPLQAAREIRRAGENEMPYLDYGDGTDVLNRFVCGFLATAVRGHTLLEALPPLLVTNVRGRPSAEWVESSFRYAAREHAARRPGSQDILGRLSELLFVEAVREHIERLPEDATGWLAALRDPSLARAMSSLHARPAHPWTAEELAKEACLSRSAFAERFTNTVGLPPMSYLTRWRMLLAGRRLRESADTIAQIAESVGYESESTFSRAFAREMGVAPGAWRRPGEG